VSDQYVQDCMLQPPFPLCPDNRPGRSRISYRIGDYGQIRASLLAALNKDDILAPWTHRGADDPGIALLEGAAILGDILTFYQELYANEAFLRTATWRESVSDLVRLLGYRTAPGVGGHGVFAFEARGESGITIPAGFPITALVTGLAGQADFQTTDAVTAYPWLSRFSLYRPVFTPGIGASTTEIRVTPNDGSDIALKAGDKLLIGEPGHDGELANAEIVIIDSARQRHGENLYKLKGRFQRSTEVASLTGYKLGRTFHHLGNNSPPVAMDLSVNPPKPKDVSFDRSLTDVTTDSDPSLQPNEMALDARIDNLPLGSPVICQYETADLPLVGASTQTTKTRAIAGIRQGSYTWGAITAQSTVLRLDRTLEGGPGGTASAGVGGIIRTPISAGGALGTIGGGSTMAFDFYIPPAVLPPSLSGPSTRLGPVAGRLSFHLADIRTMLFHETASSALTVEARPEAGAASSGNALGFVGTAQQAQSLNGRWLLLLRPNEEPQRVAVQGVTSLPASMAGHSMHRIELDTNVSYADFPLEEPAVVTVYGNLANATQGKRERDATIGSGDSRAPFQTFKLPKSPLTYLTAPSDTPPETPELEIHVAGRKWQHVSSFFNYGPKDEVYIVREDAAGDSWVQFGDGKTGARLPSGLNNVLARYRSGVAASGPLAPGTTPQAGTRLDKLDKIQMPGVISGGEAAESPDNARAAAPGRVQSLDRLVSLADFASEALSIAGVARASAAWRTDENVPSVVLTVLMDAGREQEIENIRSIMALASRSRGPSRFPVVVHPGQRLYYFVGLSITYDSAYHAEDVEAAVRLALGAAGVNEGPDGTSGRAFGERVYATQIEGIVQNVPGVQWAHVNRLATRWLAPPLHPNPLGFLRLLFRPLVIARHEVLTPGLDAILALSNDDLQISLTAAEKLP
jgi:hypothetical protein